MTSVLLLASPDSGAPPLAADFAVAGFEVRGEGDCAHLVRATLQASPDVLVCWASRPDEQLLQSIAVLQAQQHVPVLFFTNDADVECMQRALDAGVHAWVVQGYAPQRLRALVHLAQMRERQERVLREKVAQLGDKLDERKWVDQAKGILMRTQQVSEEDAFRLLRTASMQANRKVAQLSKEVIAAARVADAINRAGQQRMISQRLVKLYALACSGTDSSGSALLMKASMQRVEDNLAALEAALSPATYGDLVAAARAGWQALREGLEARPDASQLATLDAAAQAVLTQADALVRALEASGEAPQVHVVNVAGRQRMLSQRTAKQALLGDASLTTTVREFEQGLATLRQAPLCTPQIRAMLAQSDGAWQALLAAVPAAQEPAGRMKLAAASEELLEVFDRLTGAYQHSVQVLMGG